MALRGLFALLLLCFEQGATLRTGEKSGFKLRSREAKLDKAFRDLRASFKTSHPGWQSQKTTELKSVTPAPLLRDGTTLMQRNAVDKVRPFVEQLEDQKDVLFGVWTDSLFYDTRLTGILETWGKEISPDHFMAVSDKKRNATGNVPGTQVEETRCPPHSHWEGACCKWAEGVILAQQRMEKNPSLKWAFFSDDDVYVLPHAVADALHQVEDADSPQALGVFGCSTPTGCSGLCGGGGFAVNRAALDRLAAKDPSTFLQEEMSYCYQCQRWADQAISMVWRDKGIAMKQLTGLNGWRMKLDAFRQQLEKPNLLFHYQRTQHQMEALHEIFTGERLLSNETGPCVEYHGRTSCAASADPSDVPFDTEKLISL